MRIILLALLVFALPLNAAEETQEVQKSKKAKPLNSFKTKLRINKTERNPQNPFNYVLSFVKPEMRDARFQQINTRIQEKIDKLKEKSTDSDKAKLAKLESKLLKTPDWDNGKTMSVLVFSKKTFEQTKEELGTQKGKFVSNPELPNSMQIVDFKYQSLCKASAIKQISIPESQDDPLNQYVKKMYIKKQARNNLDYGLAVIKAEFDPKCLEKEAKKAHLELGHASGKKVYMPLPKKL